MSSSTFKLRVAALRPLLLVRRHNLNVRLVSRSIHSSSSSSHVPLLSRKLWTRAFFVAGVVGTSSVAYSTLCSPVHAESIPDLSDDTSSRRPTRSQPPLSSLVRAYVVYSLCSIPMLVDYSPSILSTLMAIPGISHISEFFIRHTFFAQFVGAETAKGLMPILEQLRKERKGALVNYSVEANAGETAGKSSGLASSAKHNQLIEEYIHSVDVAGDFEDQRGASVIGRRTWVPLKLTALVPDTETLRRFSIHLLNSRPKPKLDVAFPGSPRPSDFDIMGLDPVDLPETCPLTKEDIAALKELRDDLFRICNRARKRNVRILIDAEYTWYQPAIDAFQLDLMREFNRLPQKSRSWSNIFSSDATASSDSSVQPLVYGTFQAYLRRTPAHIAQSFLDAKEGHYALGVKLVRGAYHPFESTTHAEHLGTIKSSQRKFASPLSISNEELPPVWSEKDETDACYDACARVLLRGVKEELKGGRGRVERLGVVFGTHNGESVRKVLQGLVEEGLASYAPGNRTIDEGEGLGVVRIPDEVGERITFGQLYGMREALTNYIVEHTESTHPCVVKCLPYGALSEVLPYLVRRAIENKSVLNKGSAAEERRRAGKEIVRRVWRSCALLIGERN